MACGPEGMIDTILLVHALDFPKICAIAKYVEIELVVKACCCELGSGEFAERVKVDIVDYCRYAMKHKDYQQYHRRRQAQRVGTRHRGGKSIHGDYFFGWKSMQIELCTQWRA